MLKCFLKIKNKFKRYKNSIADIKELKDSVETLAGSIIDIYNNLGEAKWDIVELKAKVKDMEAEQE